MPHPLWRLHTWSSCRCQSLMKWVGTCCDEPHSPLNMLVPVIYMHLQWIPKSNRTISQDIAHNPCRSCEKSRPRRQWIYVHDLYLPPGDDSYVTQRQSNASNYTTGSQSNTKRNVKVSITGYPKFSGLARDWLAFECRFRSVAWLTMSFMKKNLNL